MHHVRGCTCDVTSGGVAPYVPRRRDSSCVFRCRTCGAVTPGGNAGVAGVFTRCYGVHTLFFVDRKSCHRDAASCFCGEKR